MQLLPIHITTFFHTCIDFSTVLHVHVYMDNDFTNDFLERILAVLVLVWLVRHYHYSIKLNTSQNYAQDKNTNVAFVGRH